MSIQLQLSNLLSEQRCHFSADQLAPYLQSLTHTSKRVLGVVKPITINEIQQILAIANEQGISIYPISQGNNWGYGEKLPVQHDCLILDLSGLNQITEFNAEIGYIKVQPGVTQGQLDEFLQQQPVKYMVPMTGAGPFGSILGNAIDRGYGITPYCDHFQAITELKVMLADGKIIQTGLSRFGAEHSGPVFRWGIGPYQDGLYAQANLGIVLEATILLKKVPSIIKVVHFTLETDEQLAQTQISLKELLDNQTIGSGISLFSGLRALAVSRSFPYELIDDATDSSEIFIQLLQEKRLAPWMGFFAVYGSSAKLVNAQLKEVKRRLKPSTRKIIVFSRRTVNGLTWLNNFLKSVKLSIAINNAQNLLKVVSGRPIRYSLNQAFWRSKLNLRITESTQATDITANDNGLMWFSPIIPFTPAHFQNIYQLMQPIFKKYHFECMFGCACFSAHFLDVTIPILFNKHDEQERQRALACYDELFAACLAAGYMPYRLGIDKMNLLPTTAYDQVNTRLKSVLDPKGILAPGRYVKS